MYEQSASFDRNDLNQSTRLYLRYTSPTFSTRGKRRAKSIGVYRKSPLQSWDLGASGPLRGRDARRWLRRQIELELLEQQLLVGIELSIAAEDQHASVICREVHVEHLHRGHLVEHRP